MALKKEDSIILDEISEEITNWSKLSRESYEIAVKNYTTFHGKSLAELIKEADEEELKKIRWKDRKLRKRLLTYRAFVYDKYLKTTAQAYFSRIISIYGFLEIEMHKLPKVNEKGANLPPPIYYEDLPTNKKIRLACDISDPLMTAILLFMSSSGQARQETLNLTIRDFIKATQRYHTVEVDKETTGYEGKITSEERELKIIKNNEEITNHEEILKRVLNDLIVVEEKMYPSFQIKRQKTNKYFRTFCSDEATRAIVNYLLTRSDKIDLDKKLFKTNLTYFNRRFKYINDNLNLGKLGSKNKFTSHMLRRFHSSNLNKSVKKPDGTTEKGMSESEIDALQGKVKVGTRKSYYFNDFEALREQYIHFSDGLKIYDNTDESDFKTEEYREREKKLKNVIEEKDKIISNFAGENLKLKQDTEEFKTSMNKEMEKINEKLKKYEDVISREEERFELNAFVKLSRDSEIIQKIMMYVYDTYGVKYLTDINFVRKIVELNDKKELNKMKQKYWKKEVVKIVVGIQPINIDELVNIPNLKD